MTQPSRKQVLSTLRRIGNTADEIADFLRTTPFRGRGWHSDPLGQYMTYKLGVDCHIGVRYIYVDGVLENLPDACVEYAKRLDAGCYPDLLE